MDSAGIFSKDTMDEVAIAVDTDELIDFIIEIGRESRMLIRRMSIEAARHFGLAGSTVGDLSYLYLRAPLIPKNDPEMAAIIRWARELADREKMIYLVRIGREPEDFEEIRTDKFGSLGIDLKKCVYFRAA